MAEYCITAQDDVMGKEDGYVIITSEHEHSTAENIKAAIQIPPNPALRPPWTLWCQPPADTRMALRTIGPKAAAALDEELMSTTGGFSLDQLMELAGLAVSQAVYILSPPSKSPNVLVACGPGNNGGDGLVCARHLQHFGYKPSVYYPKPGKNELYAKLRSQLEQLKIPFTNDFVSSAEKSDFLVDAVFGFSFSGEVREPFPAVIRALAESTVPVLAVDAPSSWHIDQGPPSDGPGKDYRPDALISLTAPKPLVRWFKGRHFVGGRFIPPNLARKYAFDIPPFQGSDQVVEVGIDQDQKL